MYNYGIGGTEVKQDASESMTDIPKNRTLLVQKLTADDPIRPEVVYDLKTVEEVFDHFKPEVDVEFETPEGTPVEETLRFSNVGDFSLKNITEQSNFLQDLNIQEEQYQKLIKQLKTNKLLKSVIENPDSKAAFITALQAMIQELEDSHK